MVKKMREKKHEKKLKEEQEKKAALDQFLSVLQQNSQTSTNCAEKKKIEHRLRRGWKRFRKGIQKVADDLKEGVKNVSDDLQQHTKNINHKINQKIGQMSTNKNTSKIICNKCGRKFPSNTVEQFCPYCGESFS